MVKYEMWDTAGQERYRSLAQMYYKNAIGACVVFDVTNRDSFDKCQQWVKELMEKASAEILIVIVGNKIDLEDRKVTAEEAQDYARGQGLIYYEVSAKQNVGIDDLFRDLAKKLPKESTNKKTSTLRHKRLEQKEANEGGYSSYCCQ
jgi:small GTP-binding protein